jgi:hypothetical protein
MSEQLKRRSTDKKVVPGLMSRTFAKIAQKRAIQLAKNTQYKPYGSHEEILGAEAITHLSGRKENVS